MFVKSAPPPEKQNTPRRGGRSRPPHTGARLTVAQLPAAVMGPAQAAGSSSSWEVQWGQRVAAMGISLQQ